VVSKYPKVKIGDFVEHVVREIELDVDKEYPSVGVKWYGEGVHVHEVKSGSDFNAARFEIKANDIIYNDMWARKGSVAIVPPHLDGAVASSHFPTFLLDLTRVSPKYLEYYFKSPIFWEDCESASRGSTGRNQIKKSTFFAIEIPLPPLDDQRRIVARIEALATRITEAQSLRRETSEEAKVFMQATLREVFGKSANWKNYKLDDVAPINMGQSPSGDSYNADGEGFPLLNGPTEFSQHHPTPRQWTTSPTKFCKSGDILICVRGATTGKMNWADQKYCIGRGLAALTADTDKCVPEYVFYFVQTQTQEILSRTAGSTFPNLPGDKLKTLPIPVPPLKEQRRLVAYLDGLQAKVSTLLALQNETLKELDALMPSILDKAFKGEL
jgi:type I restriction enzyme S subunit